MRAGVGLLRFFFQDNVRQALARFLLELAGEAQAAKEQSLRFVELSVLYLVFFKLYLPNSILFAGEAIVF